MKNMKVAAKLITGFTIVAILTVIVGIVGIVGLNSLNSSYTSAIESHAKPLPEIGEAMTVLQLMRVDIRSAIYNTGNLAELRPIESSLKDYMEDFESLLEPYGKTIAKPEVLAIFESAKNTYTSDFKPMVFQVLADAKNGVDQATLLGVVSDNLPSTEEMIDEFFDTMAGKVEMLDTTSAAGASLANTLFVLLLIILIAAVLTSIILGIYISGLISKPLAPFTAFMIKAGTTGDITLDPEDTRTIETFSQRKDELGQSIAATGAFIEHITAISKNLEIIADGDLTVDISLLSDKDTMGRSLQKTANNLNRMFSEVSTSTTQVSSSSKQVADTAASIASSATQMASGAQSLAEGTTRQSASVEELTNSIAQVAEKTLANAGKTDHAAKLAQAVITKAEQGSRQMDEMIAAVNDITEASKSIRIIIETIDSIALQTNLLALNAAIEAAQAGEHGKGFAVVAEEVRKLAGQSAEAVQETSSVIQNSMQKTELGARVANEMAASLTEIVSSINESNQLITEIAKASEEQSSSISHINSTIDQVSQIVHQNSATAQQSAAAAQESAAAADEMSSQSTLLEKAISRFKTKDRTAGRQGLFQT